MKNLKLFNIAKENCQKYAINNNFGVGVPRAIIDITDLKKSKEFSRIKNIFLVSISAELTYNNCTWQNIPQKISILSMTFAKMLRNSTFFHVDEISITSENFTLTFFLRKARKKISLS